MNQLSETEIRRHCHEALADLASYNDLVAEIEGLRSTFLTPMASHPDQRVGDALATLEACLNATVAALVALRGLAQ